MYVGEVPSFFRPPVYAWLASETACKISKLAGVFVATKAAPTSPNVLGTELVIGVCFSEISIASSAWCDSGASLLERPARMIKEEWFDTAAVASSSLAMVVKVWRGFAVERVEKVMRDKAPESSTSEPVGVAYRAQAMLSAVSDWRRVCVFALA